MTGWSKKKSLQQLVALYARNNKNTPAADFHFRLLFLFAPFSF